MSVTQFKRDDAAQADGPLPLFPPLPKAEPYPVDALGPVLSKAAQAIARKVQVPAAIAAQSVLATGALAAQAHADVQLPFGQARPLSLDLVTIAASGERKSTADNEALWPIRKREAALADEYDSKLAEWLIDHAAWSGEKRKIENEKKLNLESRKFELAALGTEPQRPLYPFLTAPDPTIEGLAKAWAHAPGALGVFTAEGGQFVGGHGMSQDNRLKTAAMLSEVWDGKPLRRIRAGDGVSILPGRRLSVHLMVQPEAAAQFFADTTLRDQGLLSRVLVAQPESIAGTRLYRETEPEDEAAIRAYGARILSLLEASWPLANGKVNELAPPALLFSADAERAWRAFYNHVEEQCGPSGELTPIRDFAAKSAEHAARIAGVLTIVEDRQSAQIGINAMRGALQLIEWYLKEALRLQKAARTDTRLLRAQVLLEWMQTREESIISFRDILRLGPNAVRTKAAADDAVAVLIDHNWIEEVSTRPRRLKLLAGRPDAKTWRG